MWIDKNKIKKLISLFICKVVFVFFSVGLVVFSFFLVIVLLVWENINDRKLYK